MIFPLDRPRYFLAAMLFSLFIITSGCATGGGGYKAELLKNSDEHQMGEVFDVSHIDNAARFVAESISRVPEFADPTLQPWILVELDKVDSIDRQLVINAQTVVRRFVTYLMKMHSRRANFISLEDYKKAEEWRQRILSGTVTGGQDDASVREYRSPDFLLELTITDAPQANPDGTRVVYVLYSFRLTDRRTLKLVWQEDYRPPLVKTRRNPAYR